MSQHPRGRTLSREAAARWGVTLGGGWLSLGRGGVPGNAEPAEGKRASRGPGARGDGAQGGLGRAGRVSKGPVLLGGVWDCRAGVLPRRLCPGRASPPLGDGSLRLGTAEGPLSGSCSKLPSEPRSEPLFAFCPGSRGERGGDAGVPGGLGARAKAWTAAVASPRRGVWESGGS